MSEKTWEDMNIDERREDFRSRAICDLTGEGMNEAEAEERVDDYIQDGEGQDGPEEFWTDLESVHEYMQDFIQYDTHRFSGEEE